MFNKVKQRVVSGVAAGTVLLGSAMAYAQDGNEYVAAIESVDKTAVAAACAAVVALAVLLIPGRLVLRALRGL